MVLTDFGRQLADALDFDEDLDDALWRLVAQSLTGRRAASSLRRALMKALEEFYAPRFERLTALLASPEGKALQHAYADCARYMTHPEDAAHDWDVDLRLLRTLLAAAPPASREDRWRIKPPLAVKNLREVVCGGVEMRQETIDYGKGAEIN